MTAPSFALVLRNSRREKVGADNGGMISDMTGRFSGLESSDVVVAPKGKSIVADEQQRAAKHHHVHSQPGDAFALLNRHQAEGKADVNETGDHQRRASLQTEQQGDTKY